MRSVWVLPGYEIPGNRRRKAFRGFPSGYWIAKANYRMVSSASTGGCDPKIIEFEKTHTLPVPDVEPRILITSLSKKVPLAKAVANALKKLNQRGTLYGADVDSDCLGQYFVDSFWKMPRTTDSNLPAILDYCFENKIQASSPLEMVNWNLGAA